MPIVQGGTRRRTSKSRTAIDFAPWDETIATLGLSQQQAKITELIVRGMKDKEIAAEMKLGFSTVRTYLERIFDRLAVGDRMELIIHVMNARQRLRQ